MAKAFNHIITIMFENKVYEDVMQDPYLSGLAKQGILMSNFYAVTHPSQPNYVASTSGWTANVYNDGHFDIPETNVVDLLEPAGVSWKAYMEDLPMNNKLVDSYGGIYYRKHNPFASYTNIQNDPSRLAKVVNADDPSVGLQADLNNGTFPKYAWYTPNIYNDGHSTQSGFQSCNTTSSGVSQLIQQISCWTANFLDTYASQFPEGTLIVLTFDEDYPYTSNPDDDNHIYTMLIGDVVSGKAGTEITDRYNLYSLLTTVEHNFDLGNLDRNDAEAQYFRFLWGESYSNGSVSWGAKTSVGGDTNGGVGSTAMVEYNGTVYLFYQSSSSNHHIHYHTYTSADGWSDSHSTVQNGDNEYSTGGAMAAAVYNGKLFLTYVSDSGSGHIYYTTFDGSTWAAEHHVSNGSGDLGTGGPLALATQNGDLYLIYLSTADDGHMHFTYWDGSAWADDHHVQNYHTSTLTTDGDIAACHFGELTLVYEGHGTEDMYWVQYDGISDNQWTYDLNSGHNTDGAIAVATAGGKMWIVYKSNSSNHLHYNNFENGAFNSSSWELQIDGDQMETDGPIALCSYGDDVMVAWKGVGETSLYASLGTVS